MTLCFVTSWKTISKYSCKERTRNLELCLPILAGERLICEEQRFAFSESRAVLTGVESSSQASAHGTTDYQAALTALCLCQEMALWKDGLQRKEDYAISVLRSFFLSNRPGATLAWALTV